MGIYDDNGLFHERMTDEERAQLHSFLYDLESRSPNANMRKTIRFIRKVVVVCVRRSTSKLTKKLAELKAQNKELREGLAKTQKKLDEFEKEWMRGLPDHL